MLLVINIGNSNIRFGVLKQDKIIDSWTINTRPYRTEDELFAKFNGMYEPFGYHPNDFDEMVIASVVPPLTNLVQQALKRIHGFSPVIIDRNSPSLVQHQSNQIGTDLYANAVAAQTLYEGHKIVVDFGTALTFIGIGPNGESLGVSIGPGIQTALNSLVGATAQLPEIEMKKPNNVLGFNTVDCMQSGMIFGYLSLIEGMIERINQEVGAQCFVIATGGLSGVYAPLSSKIDVQDQMHTLKGIVAIYQFNKK